MIFERSHTASILKGIKQVFLVRLSADTLSEMYAPNNYAFCKMQNLSLLEYVVP